MREHGLQTPAPRPAPIRSEQALLEPLRDETGSPFDLPRTGSCVEGSDNRRRRLLEGLAVLASSAVIIAGPHGQIRAPLARRANGDRAQNSRQFEPLLDSILPL